MNRKTQQINYIDIENLISEVVTNKIYRNQENFDLVVKQFFKHDITGFKTKFIQNLVVEQIDENMRFLYDIKNINYRINKFVKNSSVVVKDSNNIVREKHFSKSFEELTKSTLSFRKYLFLCELEKVMKLKKSVKRKRSKKTEANEERRNLQKFYEKKLQEIHDKSRKRYFTMYSYIDIHEERQQHIIDYDDIHESEIDKYVIDIMRDTLYDNDNSIDYDIHFTILKNIILRERAKHTQQQKIKKTAKRRQINAHELLKKLREFCMSD